MLNLTKIKDKVTKYKYVWYLPITKNNIKVISKGNDKKILQQKILQKTIKHDNIPLILLELIYKDKPATLIPGRIIIKINTFIKKNNKLITHPKFKTIGLVHFTDEYLEDQKFRYRFLKNIIIKSYFDKIKFSSFGKHYYQLV